MKNYGYAEYCLLLFKVTASRSSRMTPKLACLTIAIVLWGTSAFACSPDPNFDYDQISSDRVSIFIARVVEIDRTTHENEVCWQVDYVVESVLTGVQAEAFSVLSCSRRTPQMIVMTRHEGNKEVGFVEGAEVLLGVLLEDDGPTGVRYAVPSCWGPLHLNIGILTLEQRNELIAAISAQVSEEAEK